VLPFVPIFLIRNQRLETLVIGGCVGLGFAVQENLQYFAEVGPTAAFGRFLTANFFHFAATGLVGLALCDWLRSPVAACFHSSGPSSAVIVAHGCYDALSSSVIRISSP
jgi:RsiW-degrading membrane proteinase PrsW (M82 family)